jgi:hypothetical protein
MFETILKVAVMMVVIACSGGAAMYATHLLSEYGYDDGIKGMLLTYAAYGLSMGICVLAIVGILSL